mgnify:CR=1 FL=1
MEIREVYKIGVAEYTFGGSVFEQIIDGAPHLDLTKIGVVSDEHTHFFEIDINNKDLLVNLLNTNIELLDHYKNDIVKLLNNVTDKIIKALESDYAARLMFGGTRRTVQKIHLDKLERTHTAMMVYEERIDKFVPIKLYIFYVVETIMLKDAFLHTIQEMFPYKDPLLKEELKEETKND